MEYLIVGLLGLNFLVLMVLAVKMFRGKNGSMADLGKLEEIEKGMGEKLEQIEKGVGERLVRVEAEVEKLAPKITEEFRESRKEIATELRENRKEMGSNLKNLQDDNAKKLEQMRETVDEKLRASVEKRFNESFKGISEQLSQVHEGLGEMKKLANGVGDLRKVMEGVKTRGVYGEVQLGEIIKDILSPTQYEENFATKKGSDRVEFVVKMPGSKEGSEVYLPIDSKFPVENYSRLLMAYEEGGKEQIEKCQKALANDVKEQAKKIESKYVEPPMTTAFGLMFVPTESLYAEILRIPGLYTDIQQKFKVNIVSPSTLPVVLSGLLMGFRTVAIEKRSSEVWQTLGAVKTQFGKFGDLLAATKKKLEETANKIGAAETTSRQIERKLKDVESLPERESVKLIGEI